MAITTLDGVLAGMQPPQDFMKVASSALGVGRLFSPFYTAGTPGPAVAPSPGIAGAALTTYAGQIPFVNGAAKQYLARLTAYGSIAGTLLLCDRLWHNSGIAVTTTTAQTITSAAWPARDSNASTNGEGVRIGLEVSTITGAGASAHSIVYTNQAGTGSKAGSPRINYSAASAVGTFYDYTLAAGDTGVRSVQTFTSSVSMTSGAVHLVAYRVLARIGVPLIQGEIALDALTSGMPEMFANTVPFLLWVPSSASSVNIGGSFVQTNG